MQRSLIAAIAAAMLGVSTAASYAAEAKGAIVAIDPAAGTVTLADGQVFKLPAEFDAASLQVGQEVTITYEASANGTNTTSTVTPLPISGTDDAGPSAIP